MLIEQSGLRIVRIKAIFKTFLDHVNKICHIIGNVNEKSKQTINGQPDAGADAKSCAAQLNRYTEEEKYNMLFKQRKTKLFNGQSVKEGDFVSFINSDGKSCIDKIRRRKDKSLYFWNNAHNILEYKNAAKTTLAA